MTKLSEKLAKLAYAGGTLGPVYGVMADDARAIEERAENAEAQLEYVRATVRTQEQTAQELEERAEAAEAKLKWHEETQRTYYDVEARAAAAEAEVARLRDERDALRAKLDAVRAEVDAIIDFEDGWKLQEQLLGVLDGKGGDEA